MKKKTYHVEFYDKGIYEFDNFNEARKWAKGKLGETSFYLFHYKNYSVARVKKDMSFTQEVERNSELMPKSAPKK